MVAGLACVRRAARGAVTAAAALLTPPVVVAGLIALRGDATAGRILWPVAGMLAAVLCYCAVTAWLSTVTRRPVVLGVLYILLWEGSIATFAASADRLSIAAYGRVLAVEGVIDVNAPEISAPVAVIVLAIVIAVAIRHGVALEVNGLPDRLDLAGQDVRLAIEAGVPVVVSTDAHSVRGLGNMQLAVATARRGWASAAHVLKDLGFLE